MRFIDFGDYGMIPEASIRKVRARSDNVFEICVDEGDVGWRWYKLDGTSAEFVAEQLGLELDYARSRVRRRCVGVPDGPLLRHRGLLVDWLDIAESRSPRGCNLQEKADALIRRTKTLLEEFE